MTEAEWLAWNDPEMAVRHLVWMKASDRKLRLIACACCRLLWDEMPNAVCRKAVEVSERFADGLATEYELGRIAYSAEVVVFGVDAKVERYRKEQAGIRAGWLAPEDAAEEDVLYGPGHVRVPLDRARRLAEAAELAAGGAGAFLERADRSLVSRDVVLDIIGNPFRPVTPDPAWLTDTVVALARGMYESRDFAAMPILADALQDTGCDNSDVLAHCRGPGPHVRGCWVVDQVLGKS